MDDEYYDEPEVVEETQLNVLLSNTTYDRLKWVAQILLPALGALYFGLAAVWGFPHGEKVIGTLASLDLFLGAVLGISSRKYKTATEGALVGFADVTQDETGKKSVMLNFPGDPTKIDQNDKITFKVRRHT